MLNKKFKYSVILLDKLRIKNFRSLENFEIELKMMTVLAGVNNSGKTTLLKALNLLFGAKKFQPTRDDLFINSAGEQPSKTFSIDARIIPIDDNGIRAAGFDDKWLSVFGNESKVDSFGEFFAMRYVVHFSGKGDRYKTELFSIEDWDNPEVTKDDSLTLNLSSSINLYYIDAQRDLSHDISLRHSYFGRLAAQVNDSFDKDSSTKIIEMIKDLNEEAIANSEVLNHLQSRLSQLNKTANDNEGGVSISPFSTSVRDLHKGMKVNFQDGNSEKFSLEYHGMGTRSWASLLSFKAFTSWETLSKIANNEPYFPILALEEPEAHLHPNAQRTLYDQLNGIDGQKIISTHSPYIAAQANLDQLRYMYKPSDSCTANMLEFSEEDEFRIATLLDEIQEEGSTIEINRKNRPLIKELLDRKKFKLNKDDVRKIERVVMNTRGELLFSKVIVLFEGETEEQALPILAKAFFKDKSAFDYGINFVGVGGKQYGPFINLARFLQIPFFILSDGDGNSEDEVKAILSSVGIQEYDNLVVLDQYDFEEYLLQDGYRNELILGINDYHKTDYFPETFCNEQHGQFRTGGLVKQYLNEDGTIDPASIDQALLDCLYSEKTIYAPFVAERIIQVMDQEGKCKLPTKIVSLLDAVKKVVIS